MFLLYAKSSRHKIGVEAMLVNCLIYNTEKKTICIYSGFYKSLFIRLLSSVEDTILFISLEYFSNFF